MKLAPEEIEILSHTISGLNRNHFVAGVGHSDMPVIEKLVNKGLMVRGRTPGFVRQTDMVFHVTDAGRAALSGV